LIAWERAEICRITKEKRNVSQIANGRIVYDRVPIVEVKAVVEMICVG
jgi:hypothetical protein